MEPMFTGKSSAYLEARYKRIMKILDEVEALEKCPGTLDGESKPKQQLLSAISEEVNKRLKK
jgi:hypothetical protein